MLLEQRNPEPWLPGDLAASRLHLTGEQTKERRLPRSVAANDAPAIARADGKRDVLEQRGGAELDGHARRRKLCHFVTQAFQSCSAAPIVSALPLRTSGMRR